MKLNAALHCLGLLGEEIEWQHDPPIQLRIWNEEKQDTEPSAYDPRYLTPMLKAEHRKVTAKVDIPQIAKTKRMSEDQNEFRRKILSRECGEKRKPKGKIPTRGFPKRRKP